jgi:hypothetical protein
MGRVRNGAAPMILPNLFDPRKLENRRRFNIPLLFPRKMIDVANEDISEEAFIMRYRD